MSPHLLLGALALSLSMTRLQPAADQEAAEIVERAEASFKDGDYADAAEAFARAYALDPEPRFLYARAQAERLAGNCEQALVHYDEFLALDLTDDVRAPAEANRLRCERTLARRRPEPAPPAPERGATDTHREPPPPTPVQRPSSPAADRPVDSWGADPLAVSLTASGGVVAIVGAGLWGSAVALDNRANERPNDDAYLDTKNAARSRLIAGATLSGIGAAALLGGIIRYGVLGARARRREGSGLAISPSVQPRQSGLVLQGRF